MLAAIFGLACLFAVPKMNAANITVDGINYTTKAVGGENTVTVAKYTAPKNGDTIFYEGDIVIPEFVTYNGVDYHVIAVAANAFLDCVNLTSLQLPESCVTIGRNAFKGCTGLTASPLPMTATSIGSGFMNGCTGITELTIPPGYAGPMVSQDIEGCVNLRKIIFAESATPLVFTIDGFGKESTSPATQQAVQEMEIYRDIDASNYANNKQPFHNMGALQKITIGGTATNIAGTMFQGCGSLQQVIFAEGNVVTSIGANAFLNCPALQSFIFPEAVTTVQGSTFSGCTSLASVTLSPAATTIEDGAFYNCRALKSIELPATITKIGGMAFMGSGLEGEIVLPEALTTIGAQAFANSKLTAITIPATVASIGNAAFAPITTLAAITVAEGNANFKVENGLLTNTSGQRLLVAAHQGDIGTELVNDVITTIDNYGLAYAPFTSISLPALQSVGNFGFAYSALDTYTLAANVTVGYNLFTGSAITSLTLADGRNEIPNNLAYNCKNLETLVLPSTATNIQRDAFAGCTALKDMEIPANVNYMEPGAVPATIETLRVLNGTTPVLAAGVFAAEQSNVLCKVAAASVDKYQAAAQWNYLNIVADPTIEVQGATLGCPTGLYFATKDGKLMYKDPEGQVIDTHFTTGAHAFNLASYKNRIYVGVAGEKFMYQDANAQANGGDGEVFYVNNTNGIFYRVTVLNNVGYKAFEDPFSLSINNDEGKIYIADRNVGIHVMNADTVGLYGSQPFLVQNNQLPYYKGDYGWMYGGIGCGFYKFGDTYWMGKKFNGFGIFRFRDQDIYAEGSGASHENPFKAILPFVQMTQYFVDNENGYIYFYLQNSRQAGRNDVPGVYRLPLSAVETADAQGLDTDMSQAVLLDDSPVLLEGSGDEITGVTQFTSDGEHVYWAYIASPSDDRSVPSSTPVDAENPLHHSGIKCVNAKPESPTEVTPVQFAVEGVEAYGVVGTTYVPDVEPEPEFATGDINGDKAVDGNDLNVLINIILGKDSADNYNGRANVDATGTVDGNDLNALINILLGK